MRSSVIGRASVTSSTIRFGVLGAKPQDCPVVPQPPIQSIEKLRIRRISKISKGHSRRSRELSLFVTGLNLVVIQEIARISMLAGSEWFMRGFVVWNTHKGPHATQGSRWRCNTGRRESISYETRRFCIIAGLIVFRHHFDQQHVLRHRPAFWTDA